MTVNKNNIADSFSRAAKSYSQHDFLQREIASRVFERLSLINIKPKNILDLGCGNGASSRELKSTFSASKITAVDIAPGMLEEAKKSQSWFKTIHYQQADIDQLPFENNSFDLLFSNLTIQWLPDLKITFKELNRVLKPGGLLIFSTFGPDTLIELKQSWQQVDDKIHVNDFLDMHIVGDQVFNANFENVVMDRDVIYLTYKTLHGLMKDLKGIGAHNINENRQKGLTGKHKFKQFQQAYNQFLTKEQHFPATYEVVYGHAWKAAAKQTASDYHTHKVNIQQPLKK